uniref:Uncharacterized protein n=1 Tax=Cannabis sativa TaxID=3483 RepID=A0A803QY50_CANSA
MYHIYRRNKSSSYYNILDVLGLLVCQLSVFLLIAIEDVLCVFKDVMVINGCFARVKMKQIEIRCRGQQVLPMLTLQQVRDNIWGPTVTTLLPDSSSSSTTDHLMVLHYARTP